jgi:hypothetical protein
MRLIYRFAMLFGKGKITETEETNTSAAIKPPTTARESPAAAEPRAKE